jgi:hypothetical protein
MYVHSLELGCPIHHSLVAWSMYILESSQPVDIGAMNGEIKSHLVGCFPKNVLSTYVLKKKYLLLKKHNIP